MSRDESQVFSFFPLLLLILLLTTRHILISRTKKALLPFCLLFLGYIVSCLLGVLSSFFKFSLFFRENAVSIKRGFNLTLSLWSRPPLLPSHFLLRSFVLPHMEKRKRERKRSRARYNCFVFLCCHIHFLGDDFSFFLFPTFVSENHVSPSFLPQFKPCYITSFAP